MTFIIIMLYLGIYCIQGCVWGWAVNKIVENKGYRENWFWWGFFFGLLALLVALTKQDLPKVSGESASYFGDTSSVVGKNYVFKGFGETRKADYAKGEWRCTHCGTINASYVGTCGCGWDKSGKAPRNSAGQMPKNINIAQPQKLSILYCTSCGKQMEADSKFCRYCGAKQNNE